MNQQAATQQFLVSRCVTTLKNGCVADYILAGKRDNRHDCTTGQFKRESAEECPSGENKLSDVRSFIILRLQEGLPSFNKNNLANFSGEKTNKQTNREQKQQKKKNHIYGETFLDVWFLRIRIKTLFS